MDEFDDIGQKDKIRHLLEETEKAMRLAQNVSPSAKREVQRALDDLFRDIGRTVYNLYWKEDLQPGELGAELVEPTGEMPTEMVPASERPAAPPVTVDPNALPGFDDDYLLNDPGDSNDPAELTADDDTGWYTSEVEIPNTPMFGPEDGLEEDLP